MKTILNKATKSAELYVYEDIGGGWFGGVSSKDVADELKKLGDSVDRLTVRLNSPGGSVFEGVAIYNLLLSAKPEVHVVVDGLAASIASVVAMAGKTISMADNAMMMIHDPWGMAVGSADEMRRQAETLDAVRDVLVATYTKRTGQRGEDISDWMHAETWMTAAQATELGFADSTQEADKLAARCDMSRYPYCVPPAYAEMKTRVTAPPKLSDEMRDMLGHMKASAMRHRLDRIKTTLTRGTKR